MRDSFLRPVRRNAPVFVIAAVVLVLTQGRLLLYGGFGIDTDVMLYDVELEYRAWNSIGRYALVWLSRLMNFGGPFSVLRTGIVTLVFVWIAVLLWSALFADVRGALSKAETLVFSLLFVTSPLWTEQFYFKLQAQEVALALCFSALSVWLAYRFCTGGAVYLAWPAAVLLILSTGVYQTFAALFLTGLCAALFLSLSEQREINLGLFFRRGIPLFVCSMVVHFLLTRVFGGGSLHAASEVFWLSRPASENLTDILRAYYYVYAARTIDFTPAIALTAVLATVFVLSEYRKRKEKRRAVPVIWFLLLFAAPFSLHIILGGSLPARARYPVVLLYAFLGFLLLRFAGRNPEASGTEASEGFAQEMRGLWKNPVWIGCAALLLFGVVHSAYATLQLCDTDRTRFEEDLRFAESIWRETAPFRQEETELPLVYYGTHTASTEELYEVIGKSVFAWGHEEDDGWYNAGWIRAFFHDLGMEYPVAEEEKMQAAAPNAAAMPSFPLKGSMVLRDGILFVKLSD